MQGDEERVSRGAKLSHSPRPLGLSNWSQSRAGFSILLYRNLKAESVISKRSRALADVLVSWHARKACLLRKDKEIMCLA